MKTVVVSMIAVFSVLLLSGLIAAADGAYIVKDTNQVDQGVLNAFQAMNIEVDVIADKMIPSTDFSRYGFLFVSDDRLRHAHHLPLDMPTVLSSKFYAKEFGFLDKGGVHKISSNSILRLRTNNQVIDVYEKSRFKLGGGVGIPYYYLPQRYINEDVEGIGSTYVMKNKYVGDVISYLNNDGVNLCFFGATHAMYWTDDTKDLFKDCVEFVRGDGGNSGMHDVMIESDLVNSVNGLRIKDDETDAFILDEVAQLQCNKKYRVDFRTKNVGGFTEDVDFVGKLGNFMWDARKVGLASGDTSTTGSKTITIEIGDDFAVGSTMLSVNASIVGSTDINPQDNVRMRTVMIVC